MSLASRPSNLTAISTAQMILWALEAPLVPPLVEAFLFHVLFLQRPRLWGTQGTDSYPEYNFCQKGENLMIVLMVIMPRGAVGPPCPG